jgi:hypothetical protein
LADRADASAQRVIAPGDDENAMAEGAFALGDDDFVTGDHAEALARRAAPRFPSPRPVAPKRSEGGGKGIKGEGEFPGHSSQGSFYLLTCVSSVQICG